MTLNEVKKKLYKQKPKATIEFIRKNVAYYKTELTDGIKSEGSNLKFDTLNIE